MGLIMRENGYYYVKVEQGADVYRFSTKTKDPALAREIYQTFLKALISHQITGRLEKRRDQVTFTQDITAPDNSIRPVYLEYIETGNMKENTESTIRFKQRLLSVLEELHFSTFSDFDQAGINRFISHIREQYQAADTIMKYVSKLKTFLHYAIKKGNFNQQNFDRLDFIRLKGKVRDTIITPEDLNRIQNFLLKKNDQDFALYLETLYYTCSRPAEIVPMKVADIDFENSSIRIEQPKIAGKLQRSEKFAFIPGGFAEKLRAYIKDRKITGQIFAGARSTNKIFYSSKFQKLKKYMALPAEYNLYTVRHTAITDTLNATNDIEFASRQAGHADISTTARHYVNRKNEHYKDLAGKMEK